MSRCAVLLGGTGAVGLGAVGATGWQLAPYSAKKQLGLTPEPYIPQAAEGRRGRSGSGPGRWAEASTFSRRCLRGTATEPGCRSSWCCTAAAPGWSRGGYGVLRLAEAAPGYARAAALFSLTLVAGDRVFGGRAALGRLPLGFWCGTSDPFYAVHSFVGGLPRQPEVLRSDEGAHTRVFWNDHTIDAFSWLAAQL
jgi:hypothetical protein